MKTTTVPASKVPGCYLTEMFGTRENAEHSRLNREENMRKGAEKRAQREATKDGRNDRHKIQDVTQRVGRCLQMSDGEAREQEVRDLHNYMLEANEAGWLTEERWFTLLDLLDLVVEF